MVRRRLIVPVAVAALAAAAASVGAPGSAPAISPTFVPAGVGLDANAYVLQFAGANRESTAAAVDLDAALAGTKTGGYPFSSATAVSPKTDRVQLYGPSVCPTTLILAADDSPADALAASSIRAAAPGGPGLLVSDSTGKQVRFDVSHTALFLTESGREGATTLDTTTAAAIAKIRAVCTGSLNGIALGGEAAVPAPSFTAFAAGLADAARIAGPTRFDTAGLIADAVAASAAGSVPGSPPPLPTISYYPSASVRGPAFTNGKPATASAGQQSLLRTIFLAEGGTGADALAIGPLAAALGVPILLTDSNDLPAATSLALANLAPSNIVVLGGLQAISADVVTQGTMAAGPNAHVVRIAGVNRYATSVTIAEQLFNLYPDYVSTLGAAAYSDQLFGFARDEGSAAAFNHVGWPDAMAAGYYLADVAASGMAAPLRTAPPAEVASGSTSQLALGGPTAVCGGTATTCFANVPLLLTTGSALAPEVDTYLQAMYPKTGAYKVGGAAASATNEGGFGLVFGGSSAVSPPEQGRIGFDLSGQTYTPAKASDLAPSMISSKAFFTSLDLGNFTAPGKKGTTPVFTGGGTTDPKVCVAPGGSTGSAGVLALDQTGQTTLFPQPVEYFQAASSPYPDRMSLGACVDVAAEAKLSGSTNSVMFYAASLSGHETTGQPFAFGPASRLTTAPTGTITPGAATGSVFVPIASGSTESESFSVGRTADPVTFKGTSYPTATITLDVQLARTNASNGTDVISWVGVLTAYKDATTTDKLFTLPVTNGFADATPSSGLGGLLFGTINLVGVFGSPAAGAMEFTLGGGLLASTTVSAITADGLG